MARGRLPRGRGLAEDLFLTGDQVVVFSNVYIPRAMEGDHPICLAMAPFCGYWAADFTKVTTARRERSLGAEGHQRALPPGMLPVRRGASTQRVRLRPLRHLSLPRRRRLLARPSSPARTEEERNQAFDALEAKNEGLIRARSLDDWIRKGGVKRPGQPTAELGYACTDFALSTAPQPARPTSPWPPSTSTPTPWRAAPRCSPTPAPLYASRDTLYVASAHWWWWPAPGQSDATYIHAASTSGTPTAPATSARAWSTARCATSTRWTSSSPAPPGGHHPQHPGGRRHALGTAEDLQPRLGAGSLGGRSSSPARPRTSDRTSAPSGPASWARAGSSSPRSRSTRSSPSTSPTPPIRARWRRWNARLHRLPPPHRRHPPPRRGP